MDSVWFGVALILGATLLVSLVAQANINRRWLALTKELERDYLTSVQKISQEYEDLRRWVRKDDSDVA